MEVSIESSWKEQLREEFSKDYFKELTSLIKKDVTQGIRIYPKGSEIFNAFSLTPFDKVKVVILGQDPYHGPGQAHGLSFSVPDGIPPPPSLVNIVKELKNDLGIEPQESGNLERWACQGVFLLNAILTVRAGQAASHSKYGWNLFTDEIIRKLSDNRSGIVFLLWGNFARGKSELMTKANILSLRLPTPPLSQEGLFLGVSTFPEPIKYWNTSAIHQSIGNTNWNQVLSPKIVEPILTIVLPCCTATL